MAWNQGAKNDDIAGDMALGFFGVSVPGFFCRWDRANTGFWGGVNRDMAFSPGSRPGTEMIPGDEYMARYRRVAPRVRMRPAKKERLKSLIATGEVLRDNEEAILQSAIAGKSKE